MCGRCVASMRDGAPEVARRRSTTPEGAVWNGTIPAELVVFHPEDWPGNYPWMQWDAWWTAGIEWSEQKMPNGHDGLLDEMRAHNDGGLPSAPWNEAAI